MNVRPVQPGCGAIGGLHGRHELHLRPHLGKAQAKRTIEIDPGFAGAHLTLGSIYRQKGMHAEAIAALQQAVTLSPGLSRATAWLGHAYAVAGHADKARRTLVELDTLSKRIPVSPYDVALIYAALGETGPALAWLEKAYHARAWDLVQLKVDRRFDSLRNDPRFVDLINRIGLPAQPS